MKLSGNTKITIKVPKRLYESIKRKLIKEGWGDQDAARTDMSAGDTSMDEVPEEFFDDLLYHFEGNQAAIDYIEQNRDAIADKVKNYDLDPESAIEDVNSAIAEGDEAVTMEELNEAVKKIKEAKKKKADADAKKKLAEDKKKKADMEAKKKKAEVDAKKKVALANKK